MIRIASFFGIFTAAVLVAYFMYFKEPHDLPIYEPADLNPALVDPQALTQGSHRILDFELVNQKGDTVRRVDVEGQILVVDFFFTRCATICPKMTANLKLIHDRLETSWPVQIMSHSVTPQADSVSVLMDYAKRQEANPELWWFLTGAKADIYKLARRSYFSCLDEGDGGFQDFVHTENIVLVDDQGRLRGFYDGTDSKAMSQLFKDLSFLVQQKAERN